MFIKNTQDLIALETQVLRQLLISDINWVSKQTHSLKVALCLGFWMS